MQQPRCTLQRALHSKSGTCPHSYYHVEMSPNYRQPKAIISTVSNISAATLESALPTSKSTSSMLAPEEIFKTATSDPRARSELTPTEKRALRAKERKARRKTRDVLDKSVDKYAKMKGIKRQKDAALKTVVKSGKGVTVVGKKSSDVLNNKSVKGRRS